MSMFELYFLTILPSVKEAFSGGGVTVLLLYACISVCLGMEGEYLHRSLWYRLGVPVTAFVMMFFASLIPSHEQLAFIVGAEWATNNEDLREVPDNVAKVINGYLEELGSEVGDK